MMRSAPRRARRLCVAPPLCCWPSCLTRSLLLPVVQEQLLRAIADSEEEAAVEEGKSGGGQHNHCQGSEGREEVVLSDGENEKEDDEEEEEQQDSKYPQDDSDHATDAVKHKCVSSSPAVQCVEERKEDADGDEIEEVWEEVRVDETCISDVHQRREKQEEPDDQHLSIASAIEHVRPNDSSARTAAKLSLNSHPHRASPAVVNADDHVSSRLPPPASSLPPLSSSVLLPEPPAGPGVSRVQLRFPCGGLVQRRVRLDDTPIHLHEFIEQRWKELQCTGKEFRVVALHPRRELNLLRFSSPTHTIASLSLASAHLIVEPIEEK
jgi:hypothetical protein